MTDSQVSQDTAAGVISRVTGPLVRATGMSKAKLYEVVRVGEERLMGEIIELHGDEAAIQVYEETAGIAPGDPVFRTGRVMSVALAPGLLESIYDGYRDHLKTLKRLHKVSTLNEVLRLTQLTLVSSGISNQRSKLVTLLLEVTSLVRYKKLQLSNTR